MRLDNFCWPTQYNDFSCFLKQKYVLKAIIKKNKLIMYSSFLHIFLQPVNKYNYAKYEIILQQTIMGVLLAYCFMKKFNEPMRNLYYSYFTEFMLSASTDQ
jgi:hypothetical protein